MSATTNADVEGLQQLILHNPVTLDLLAPAARAPGGAECAAEQGPGSAAEIAHFCIRCDPCAPPAPLASPKIRNMPPVVSECTCCLPSGRQCAVRSRPGSVADLLHCI